MTDTIWGIHVRWYRHLFFTALVLVTVLLLVEIPISDTPEFISDKQIHFLMFFTLALLCSRGMRQHYGIKLLILLAGFALLTEFLQWLVPWRSFSWGDWLADIVGILSYHALYLLKAYFRRKRS